MPWPPSRALPAVRTAPAKLNLGLRVLRRREDGYHDLETVFVPLTWADRLAATPGDGLALTVSDPALPTDDGNLVVRAARALAAHAGVEPRARLHLDKRVPYGAGLGSGSSDAAAALRLLVDLWGLTVSEPDLHRLALGLGSDVPFFMLGEPALATGRGERLAPLLDTEKKPWRSPFWLAVAVPEVHVSTAEAYGLVVPDDRPRPDLAAAILSNDLSRWRQEVGNDFEAPVVAAHPEIGRALDALRQWGAGYAAMSGSGSAVFGVFEAEAATRAAVLSLDLPEDRVWVEAPAAER